MLTHYNQTIPPAARACLSGVLFLLVSFVVIVLLNQIFKLLSGTSVCIEFFAQIEHQWTCWWLGRRSWFEACKIVVLEREFSVRWWSATQPEETPMENDETIPPGKSQMGRSTTTIDLVKDKKEKHRRAYWCLRMRMWSPSRDRWIDRNKITIIWTWRRVDGCRQKWQGGMRQSRDFVQDHCGVKKYAEFWPLSIQVREIY